MFMCFVIFHISFVIFVNNIVTINSKFKELSFSIFAETNEVFEILCCKSYLCL